MDDNGFPLGAAPLAEDPAMEAPSRGCGGGTCSSSASVITWESSSPSSETTSLCPSPARVGLPHPTPAPLPSLLLLPPAHASVHPPVPLPPLSPAGSPRLSSSPPPLCPKALAALLAATAEAQAEPAAPSWRPVEHLGTKSPFDAPVGSRHLVVESPYPAGLPTMADGGGGSRLLHVSLLIRHGTREPTRGCAARMRRVHALLAGVVAAAGAPMPGWLVTWERQLDGWERRPGLLAPSGVAEMHAAGGRFADRYHVALADVYDQGGGRVAGISVRATHKERAIASARAFVAGYMAKRAAFTADSDASAEWASAAPYILSRPTAERLRPTVGRLRHGSPDGLYAFAPPGATAHCPPGGSRAATRRPPLRPGPVVVLSSGRDASLRFFDANKDYQAFVRRHKAVGRAVTAAAPPTAPTAAAGDAAVPASTLEALGAALGGVTPAALAAAGFGMPELASLADAVAFAADTGGGGVLTDLLNEPTVAALVAAEERVRHFHRGHDRFSAATGPLCGDLARSLEAAAAAAAAEWGAASKSRRRKKKRGAGGGEGGGRRSAAVGDLRFAHAETLVPLLLLLGIDGDGADGHEYNDGDTTDANGDDADGSDAPPALSRPRARRRSGMSAMCPFGASLAIELHAPAAGVAGGVPPRVRFRLQERYVRVVRACAPHGPDGAVDLPDLLALLRRVQAEDVRARAGGGGGGEGGAGLHPAGRVAVAVAAVTGACGRHHR
ncbi:hypothetical protein I4F81_006720 [Pyropia yezoensis]|uniref:Uncharacterized protein n=1 Tax=Pyropia yezoensis TaxID=2788 RepID=A0ACC3C2G9_PYRYE|nr:hypothetical protein I4F81_006720 [Neopyropia yezoensis]